VRAEQGKSYDVKVRDAEERAAGSFFGVEARSERATRLDMQIERSSDRSYLDREKPEREKPDREKPERVRPEREKP
jgi:hypothetical protein